MYRYLYDMLDAMLTPDDLLLVLAIAEEGSVSAAAERLTTSQPAVSRTLGELERRLGAKLFERLPRGMAPTPAGQAIAEHGRAVMAVTQRAQRELAAAVQSGERELLIGIVPQISVVPVVRALASLRRLDHPVRVEAQVGSAESLLAALRAGQLDLLIGPAQPDDADIAATPLFEDQPVIVAGAGHPLARAGGEIEVTDLATYPWVMPPDGDAVTSRLRALFQDRGLAAPRPAVVTSDIPLRTSLVLTSDFLTVLPHDVSLIVMNTTPVRILPIAVPGPHSSVSALRRRDLPVRPEATYLVDSLKAELKLIGIVPPGQRS